MGGILLKWILEGEDVSWIELVHDKVLWWTSVDTKMNLQVPL
jgi:hypothetical protein